MLVLAGGYGATLLAGDVDRWPRTAPRASPTPSTTSPSYPARDLEPVARQGRSTSRSAPGRARSGARRSSAGGARVYTDSSYLKILQEQGFLGGFLFLFGMVGAVALCWRRLARAGPLSRPLGVAALVAFTAFLVLCLMGEYIEQPGKALVWTLLGVATWDAYGR